MRRLVFIEVLKRCCHNHSHLNKTNPVPSCTPCLLLCHHIGGRYWSSLKTDPRGRPLVQTDVSPHSGYQGCISLQTWAPMNTNSVTKLIFGNLAQFSVYFLCAKEWKNLHFIQMASMAVWVAMGFAENTYSFCKIER